MNVKRIIVSISIAILFVLAIAFSTQNEQYVENQTSEVVVTNNEAKADFEPAICNGVGYCKIGGETAFMMPIYFPRPM